MAHNCCKFGLSVCLVALSGVAAWGQTPALGTGNATAWDRQGAKIDGHLRANESGGVVFQPTSKAVSGIPLEDLREISWPHKPADPAVPTAAFRLRLSGEGRIAGKLISLRGDVLTFRPFDEADPILVRRAGLRGIVRKLPEVGVLVDAFERFDIDRWKTRGAVSFGERHPTSPRVCLRLVGDASLHHRLREPASNGHLRLVYWDDGQVIEGSRWWLELVFRGAGEEPQSVRITPGWPSESASVESARGPRLAVQPRGRTVGWHRLDVRFGPGSTEIALDDEELAFGGGINSPLLEIAITAQHLVPADERAPAPVWCDELQLTSSNAPTGTFEVEPSLDELRLRNSDQIFGYLKSADDARISFSTSEGSPAEHWEWSESSGISFRAQRETTQSIEGLWARISWLGDQEQSARDLDRVEGVVRTLDERGLSIEAPFLGVFSIPESRLRHLQPLRRVRRMVLDARPHHLGDRRVELLDPPQPVDSIELEFTLGASEIKAARLEVDVVQLLGIEGTPGYSELVRAGQLRTRVQINDKWLEDLNMFIRDSNETVERIEVPIADGVLQPGRNTLKIVQTGTQDEPEKRDNCGIACLALEWQPATIAPQGTQTR
jgi:hypothetical protein